MSRTERIVEKVHTHRTYVNDIKCDICGRDINVESDDDLFANDLRIELNAGNCVSTRLRRDYCTLCLEPIWSVICKAIKADPDDISDDY